MAAPTSLWVFEGTWSLEREINDRTGRGDARLTGQAVFRRSGQTLIYDETGQLKLAEHDHPIFATRRYLWRMKDPWINISFDDGRPFHAFPLGLDDPEATHLCAPDRYAVSYDFSDWPWWTSTWDVTGPKKDYRMVSRYARTT